MTARRSLAPYAFAALTVAVSTAVAFAAEPYSQLGDLAVVHLIALVLLSTRVNVRVAVFGCVLSILAFDFFFVPPRLEFAWTDAKSSLTYVAMLLVACVISRLTEQSRQQEAAARASAVQAESLLQLHVDLSTESDAERLLAITKSHLERLFGSRVLVLLGPPPGWRQTSADLGLPLAERAWSRRELVADFSMDGGAVWVPLVAADGCLGVVGVMGDVRLARDPAQKFFLGACCNQFTSALERERLAHAVHKTELEAEAERLRNSLLSAVSHDLKTPLTSIIAAGTTLLAGRPQASDGERQLLKAMVGEGERLHRLIGNLLSFARLDSPNIELRKSAESVEEIVAASVTRFRERGGKSRVSAHFAEDLPCVSVEPLLIEQVLMNLIENADFHAGPRAVVKVQVEASNGTVNVRVTDDGPGISEEEREKVFEKFYRGRGVGRSAQGVGLGLTICRAIVRAHGGLITVGARSGGGTSIEFTLPVSAAPLREVSNHTGMLAS